MENPAALFDRRALASNRVRGLAEGAPQFIAEAMAEEVLFRLNLVLRQFARVLVVGAGRSRLLEGVAQSGKAGEVIAAETVPFAGRLVIDPEALPFAPESLDAVIWAHGLASINDLPGTLIQIRRALKPDGLFLGCAIGGESFTELRQSLLAAELDMRGGASPRVAPFIDVRNWGSLLQRAGLALPVVDLDRLEVRYGEALTLMRELQAMGLGNALSARSRGLTHPALLLQAASHYARHFADDAGRLKVSLELVSLTGWAPHESQQKPLKPGSAKMRLADALKPPLRD